MRLIRLLLAKYETNVNEEGTDGWSPLLLACENGLISVVELLLFVHEVGWCQKRAGTLRSA